MFPTVTVAAAALFKAQLFSRPLRPSVRPPVLLSLPLSPSHRAPSPFNLFFLSRAITNLRGERVRALSAQVGTYFQGCRHFLLLLLPFFPLAHTWDDHATRGAVVAAGREKERRPRCSVLRPNTRQAS